MWSPGSRPCQKLRRHPGSSWGTARHHQEEEEGHVAVLVAAVAAADAEVARLDGAALEETAGTRTKRGRVEASRKQSEAFSNNSRTSENQSLNKQNTVVSYLSSVKIHILLSSLI